MLIKNLHLQNFRNHKTLNINFDDNLTFIYGENGLGKTNILEAIHLLSTTKSLRSEYDKDLICYDEIFLRIKSEIENTEDGYNLELTIEKTNDFNNKSSKKVKINQVAKSISNFSGILKSVIFTPADLDLIFSSPSSRRKYLDSIFYQISHSYKKSVLEYTKALKQRNKLLEIIKETGRGKEQLDFWTSFLIKEGSKIQNERNELFSFLNENIFSLNEKFELNNFEIKFIYIKNEISKENFEVYSQKELMLGTTLIGPHKDDFEIQMNKKDISQFGSRGQQRMALTALKILELDFIYKKTGEKPILLLDDIFSELDEKHKKAILKIIKEQQTIITSVFKIAEIEDFNCKIVDIETLLLD
jgi:DNA replication and repair protein RecF